MDCDLTFLAFSKKGLANLLDPGVRPRLLLPGHAFHIWGGYAYLGNYPPLPKAVGLYFSQALISVKEHPVPTRKDGMVSRVERVRFAAGRGKVVGR